MPFDETAFRARMDHRRANLEQENELDVYIRGFFDGLYAAGVLIPSNAQMPTEFWDKAKTGFIEHWSSLGRTFVQPPSW